MKYRISTSNKRVRCTTQLAKFVSAIQSVVLTADVFHLFTQNKSACLSVCVCATFIVFTDCERCTRPIAQTYGLWKWARMAHAWDVFRRASSRSDRGCRAAVEIVVSFGCGVILFLSAFVFQRIRPAASMRSPCPIYLYIINKNPSRLR